MTQQHGIVYPELIERIRKQRTLRRCRPDPQTRPLAIAETRPVEAQDPVAPRQNIDQPADREILDHPAVAMEQHHAWRAGIATIDEGAGIATIDEMESDTVAFEELADRRVPHLRQSRESKIGGKQDNQKDDDDREQGFHRRGLSSQVQNHTLAPRFP